MKIPSMLPVPPVTGRALLLAGAASALCCATAFGAANVIYENDFTARTSANPIPSSGWKEETYRDGLLANTLAGTDYSDPFASGSSGQVMQDGWIKATGTASVEGNASVWNDEGDPMAVLGHGGSESIFHCIVKQRIGNVFSNGLVAVRFDFKPPTTWSQYSVNPRRVFLTVGDEDYYSPEFARASVFDHSAASAGIILDNGRRVYYRGTQAVTTDAVVEKGHWVRCEIGVDLDARNWSLSAFDLGADHPDADAETPAAPIFSLSGLAFADAAVSSVSSIGLSAYGVVWNAAGDTTAFPDGAGCFDNIRVFHDGVPCYGNDFAVRRARPLAAGTRAASYGPPTVVSNVVANATYPQPGQDSNGARIVPETAGGAVAQPVGIDGWRRLPASASGLSDGEVTMRKNGDNACLRIGYEGYVVGVAQRFGTPVRDGTLRLVLDMRVPASWNGDTAETFDRLAVSLGDDTLYEGVRSECLSGRYLHVGIGYGGASYGLPRYLDANGTGQTGAYQTQMGTWYRVAVTAHLDAGTFDYVLYEQGTSAPSMNAANGTPVFSVSGVGRLNDADGISTLAVWAARSSAYFDSIRIWHAPSAGSPEVLLYQNTFNQRFVLGRATVLAGTVRHAPEKADSWYAAGLGRLNAIAVGEPNPALTFNGPEGSFGHAVHELGTAITHGVGVMEADIRPPRWWSSGDGCAYVRFGGDGHLTRGLSRPGTDDFLAQTAAGFGFKCLAGGTALGLHTNATIVAWRGDGSGGGTFEASPAAVDSSHWYRFVAKARMKESLCDVAVYDMGETHPTFATATPREPTASFSDLPFRTERSALGGVSCVSANMFGVLSGFVDEEAWPLIDNLRVSRFLGGTVVIIK